MKLTLAIAAAFAVASLASPAFAGPGEDLAAKEKCNKCHTDKDTKKGPAWKSVAAKYKGKADAADKIFLQLKNGGKVGDEDDHNKVVASDADIKALVQVVLSSK
ncbi:MAG: class I cytochrome c [Rubrivivax sp.]|nr:class I cytochrome c [Rubrivivax sp.]